MNEKAAELGLESTNYADPSGLLSDNVSSAYDMARLITLASNDERIASVMRTPEYTVYTAKHRGDHVPLHEPPARSAGRRRARGEDRLHLEVRLLPGDAAASAAERAAGRGRRASARGRTPDASSRRATCFNWLSSKASTVFAASPRPVRVRPSRRSRSASFRLPDSQLSA